MRVQFKQIITISGRANYTTLFTIRLPVGIEFTAVRVQWKMPHTKINELSLCLYFIAGVTRNARIEFRSIQVWKIFHCSSRCVKCSKKSSLLVKKEFPTALPDNCLHFNSYAQIPTGNFCSDEAQVVELHTCRRNHIRFRYGLSVQIPFEPRTIHI